MCTSLLAVQLCFCYDGQPDCSYQLETIQVNRGEPFSIELIAYDKLNNPVNANVQCSLSSSASSLGEGQHIQTINNVCTELNYTVFTHFRFENLILSIVPCPSIVANLSKMHITLDIICSCPIRFQALKRDEICEIMYLCSSAPVL